MKKIIIHFFVIFLLITLFTSCSNKLDRGKASKLIIDFYQYPTVESVKIYSKLSSAGVAQSYKDSYSKLQDKGLITMQEYKFLGSNYSIRLTDKGQKYKLGKADLDHNHVVVSNKIKFKEVTGIANIDENIAEVQFSVTRENVTPFGELNGYKNGDIINYSVVIQKYDDGWRIPLEKPIIIKVTDVSPDIFQ